MHDSHLSLRVWFWAAYWVATHTPGISAVQLQRQLGIAKYESAWFLLHRLRQGMVRANREPLSGVVDCHDEKLYNVAPAQETLVKVISVSCKY